MIVLSVRGACKAFGFVTALHGVSVDLRQGELIGLLGPNGAGKTTLIRAITGRVALDAGRIELFGHPVAGAGPRAHLGVVPQDVAVYPLLTARENLEVFGRLQGLAGADLRRQVEWALERSGLTDRSREPVQNLSGGMRRRLNLACGVVHRPPVLLLDEPTAGVDPQSRERIYEMLAALRAEGTSILLATHQLEEAEARCERIVILDHGQVVASGSLEELVDQTLGRRRLVTITLAEPLAEPPPGLSADPGHLTLRTQLRDVVAELPPLLRRVEEGGGRVQDLEVRTPSLQSVFIHLTGRELRE